MKPGIVFDATGVIYRGLKPLPFAREAFELLIKHKVPYCVLTNAGGPPEQERADRFNEYLGLPGCFSQSNLIQSNTPMKKILRSKVKKDKIFVITGNLDVHLSVDRFME